MLYKLKMVSCIQLGYLNVLALCSDFVFCSCCLALLRCIYLIPIWQECLLGLLSSKVVIYVTHQVEFLPSADLILVSHSH